MTTTLTPSISSPAAVGQFVNWSASVDAEDSRSMRYRFTVKREGSEGPFEILRDFSPQSTFEWTASESEGFYQVEMTATDLETGESASTSERFQVNPRIPGNQPQVNSTGRPLVFLYSGPKCEAGSRMRVVFGPASSSQIQATAFKDCSGSTTMNFYIAGLLPETNYTAHAVVDSGSALVSGPSVAFVSDQAPALPGIRTVLKPAAAGATERVLLASNGFATDLAGNPLWAGVAPVSILTRPETGGFFWGFVEDVNLDVAYQAIRKFDLAGMILLETNAERLNQQLAAMGKRSISSFHHEVRPLADGRIAVLAAVEQILTNVQGDGEVNVIGDMILILDRNLSVVWTWDTFDWLDVNRKAVLGETCAVGTGGCPPFYLTAIANDWTHGNSLQLTPDGALLYSARHQDWLIKIDYADGEGDGHILWKLGRGGDFTYLSADPWPWFSHQHDGNFDMTDPSELVVFDNGNTRWFETGAARSRGQSIHLDEVNKTATFQLNADLGVLAAAVGSAQKLANGNYHFEAGYVIQPDNSLAAFAIEVDKTGKIVYELENTGLVYRSFRMTDLYTAPN